jgi:cystathionine beta-synthase
LTEEIPGAFQPNQYFNQENPRAHYDTTGPEIWVQTEGRVTHLVAGVGTGGTITGAARYLKEQNPAIVVVGADPEGSLYTGDEARPYLTEGIGEDFMPESFDPSVVDHWVTVSDRDSFLTARRIVKEEGLLVGESCGTAIYAALEIGRGLKADDLVVVILPDGGRNYLSKLYNDSWMLENGFIERPGTQARIGQVLSQKQRAEPHMPDLVAIETHAKVGRAIEVLQHFGISQLPVAKGDRPEDLAEIVGSIRERSLLDRVYRDGDALHHDVVEVMEAPLPVVEAAAGVEEMFADLSRGAEAVVVVEGSRPIGVLSRADLLEFLASQASAATPGRGLR